MITNRRNWRYFVAMMGLFLLMGVSVDAGLIWSVKTDVKVIALTFDDGPKPEKIGPILDVLDQERVKATFFVVGDHVAEYPDIVKRMADSGHELANHGYTHRNLTSLSPKDIRDELRSTNHLIREISGEFPRYLRPPGGWYSTSVVQEASALGLTLAMWDVNAEDYTHMAPIVDEFEQPRQSFYQKSSAEIEDQVVENVSPGSIVLFHSGGRSTVEALPRIINRLKKDGYKLTTLSEMALKIHAFDLSAPNSDNTRL